MQNLVRLFIGFRFRQCIVAASFIVDPAKRGRPFNISPVYLTISLLPNASTNCRDFAWIIFGSSDDPIYKVFSFFLLTPLTIKKAAGPFLSV